MTLSLNARRDRVVVLDGLTRYVRQPMLESGFGLDSCIAATRIAIDVMEYFDIKAEPMPLAIFLMNGEALALAEGGATLEDIKVETHKYTVAQPGGPWTIGLGAAAAAGQERPGTWPGHLVAALPDMQLLVDLSCDQVSRPHKGMTMEPMLWKVADDDWWAGREVRSKPMAYESDEGERILAWFDREDYTGRHDEFRRSTNWRRTSKIDRVETEASFRRITGDAIRKIKADLAQMPHIEETG